MIEIRDFVPAGDIDFAYFETLRKAIEATPKARRPHKEAA